MKNLLSPKGQWILIIILVFFAIRSVYAIVRLWQAGRVVGETEQQLILAKAKQQELENKLVEVQSPEFVEREARNRLGFAKEGEVILVLPKQDEPLNIKPPVSNESVPNWKQWSELWLRQDSDL